MSMLPPTGSFATGGGRLCYKGYPVLLPMTSSPARASSPARIPSPATVGFAMERGGGRPWACVERNLRWISVSWGEEEMDVLVDQKKTRGSLSTRGIGGIDPPGD